MTFPTQQSQRLLLLVMLALLVTVSMPIACPIGSQVIPNCVSCSQLPNTTIVCDSCLATYYVTTTSKCLLCTSVISNCNNCNRNSLGIILCSSCNSNYGIRNNLCVQCQEIDGCQDCELTNGFMICRVCLPGFVVDKGTNGCVPCQISNCLVCSFQNNSFSCDDCDSGYYLSSNTCLPCNTDLPYCSKCLKDQLGQLKCIACVASQMQLQNNQCVVDCLLTDLTNCTHCEPVSISSNTFACNTCEDGYYIDPSSKHCFVCQSLNPGCSSCSTVNNVVACNACSNGYYMSYVTKSCIQCSKLISNCYQCLFLSSSGSTRCLSCLHGAYFNSTDSKCYPCLSSLIQNSSCGHCTFDGSIVCLECATGFFMNQSSLCQSCQSLNSRCKACNVSDEVFSCSACMENFYLEDSACSQCSTTFQHCLNCNSKECVTCLDGYYTLDNKVCLEDCLVSNCETCQFNSNGVCTQCLTGYRLNSGLCTIIPCNSPLSFNGVSCNCQYGQYYKAQTRSCEQCDHIHCLICSSDQCSICSQGFYLQEGTCSSCSENCQLCTSNLNCIACIDGHALQGRVCITNELGVVGEHSLYLHNNLYFVCGFGCLTCTHIACSTCIYGFGLNGTKCQSCPSNCKFCQAVDDTLTCLQCFSGTTLLNSVCQVCKDSLCLDCRYNTNFCLTCHIGYAPNSEGKCQQCQENCDFCESGSGSCFEFGCQIGYVEVGGSCARCVQGCASCNTTNITNCVGCLVGTFPSDDGKCLMCEKYCLTCNSTNCLSCEVYYKVQGQICVRKCTLPCKECLTDDSGNQVCSLCISGYSLSEGQCQPELSCISTKTCQFCPFSYFSYRGVCYDCPPTCTSCTLINSDLTFVIDGTNYFNFTQCNSCVDHYYSLEGKCVECTANCLLCQHQFMCNQCIEGYFLEYRVGNSNNSSKISSLGVCQKCSSNCKDCAISPGRCLACYSNYYLTNFRCNSLKNASFTLVVNEKVGNGDTAVADILNNIIKIYNSLQTVFGLTENSNTDITLKSIRASSVILEGNIDLPPSEATPTYQAIQSSLSNSQDLNGYQLLSSSLTPNGFSIQTEEEGGGMPFWVWIAIGGGVLLLAIIIVLCCVKCRKRSQQRELQSEKQDINGVEPVESAKNMVVHTNRSRNQKRQTRQIRQERLERLERQERQERQVYVNESHNYPTSKRVTKISPERPQPHASRSRSRVSERQVDKSNVSRVSRYEPVEPPKFYHRSRKQVQSKQENSKVGQGQKGTDDLKHTMNQLNNHSHVRKSTVKTTHFI